jgi:hypothetical protein
VGERLDTTNTKLAIHSGPATVSRVNGKRNFDVTVFPTAVRTDYVVLSLITPDRRKYYYQFPVITASHQGEPPIPAGISR